MGGLGSLFNGKEARSPGLFLANCLSVIVYHTCLSCFQPGAGAALGKTKGASADASGKDKTECVWISGPLGPEDLLRCVRHRCCCALETFAIV